MCYAESNSHVNIFFIPFICKESTGIGAYMYIQSNTPNWTVRHISKYLFDSIFTNWTETWCSHWNSHLSFLIDWFAWHHYLRHAWWWSSHVFSCFLRASNDLCPVTFCITFSGTLLLNMEVAPVTLKEWFVLLFFFCWGIAYHKNLFILKRKQMCITLDVYCHRSTTCSFCLIFFINCFMFPLHRNLNLKVTLFT